MALKKGKCRNEDCEHFDKVAEKEETDFVCECGQPLFPYKESNVPFLQRHGRFLLPLLSLLFIGLGVGLFFMLPDDEGKADAEAKAVEKAEVDTARADAPIVADNLAAAAVSAVAVQMNYHDLSLAAGESKQMSVAIAGVENAVPVWSSSNADVV